MHIFFDEGEEGGLCNGLNIIPGRIQKLSETRIGWDRVNIRNERLYLDSDFYFMHSFGFLENNIWRNFIVFKNSFLFQFHPEKSGSSGDNVLKQIKKLLNV